MRNAIPREAHALVAVNNASEYLQKLETLKSDILEEFASVEKDLEIEFRNHENTENGLL